MRATLLYGAGDIRVDDVPDPAICEPTDAVVRILRSCICGTDLWPYRSMAPTEQGRRMGHEFLGVIEDLGPEVPGLKRGDLILAPFMWSDGSCEYCRADLPTSCRNGGFWGTPGADGGQAEAIRVPHAQATLVKLPVGADSALLPSLLTLSDVLPTGHHCAVSAAVGPHMTVAVIGDGAVGIAAVLASKRLGAERILLMGRHQDRTRLGREFGATDVIPQRGEEGIERVRELTGGHGAHAVLECVGTAEAIGTAFSIARPGGVVSRVGAPQYASIPAGFEAFLHNVRLTGGMAPARAYIDELLPDILDGSIQPGRVFDRCLDLKATPEGYSAMVDRRALKVLIEP